MWTVAVRDGGMDCVREIRSICGDDSGQNDSDDGDGGDHCSWPVLHAAHL